MEHRENFWEDKVVLVTGGKGFLGSHVVELLESKNPKKIIIPDHKEYDLIKSEDCDKLTKEVDVVIHLAVDGGGIGYMRKHSGSVFYNNIMMNVLLQEFARRNGVKKFVGIGSVCEYPKFTEVPFKEEDLWLGFPEETNASYGLSKKMMGVQSQAYNSQYGFNGIHLLPTNLYGPRDDFDLESSHVIPALIRKILSAQKEGKNKVKIWGSGKASREFLFVEDCAKGILLAAENYNEPEPINLGAGEEISIKDLVYKIKTITGYEGEFEWDGDMPDGQPRRSLDVSKAKAKFGFEANVGLDEGLKETIKWYQEKCLN